MDKYFLHQLWQQHQSENLLPPAKDCEQFLSELLGLLFPAYAAEPYEKEEDIKQHSQQLQHQLFQLLLIAGQNDQTASRNSTQFFQSIPKVYAALLLDAEAIESGDPAATSIHEVLRAYPGFFAIAVYRLAHVLHTLQIATFPRILTEIAHSKTGIDIHPGAVIGTHFFIDHGTGIVIGETTVIGDNVKIYQGVTLGALSVTKEMASTKRHPTIEDKVIIYAGATILGGETVVGKGSIIGGNVWLTKSVAENSVVYHEPQLKFSTQSKNEQ
jgi:serine O-acetyltransferase